MLQQVKRATSVQAVVGQLVELIRVGALKPGDRLPSEAELSRRLEVGRSTVREALQTLAAKGLIEISVGRGSYVRDLDAGALVDGDVFYLLLAREALPLIQEARGLLETGLAALSAQRATPDDLALLDELVDTAAARGWQPVDGEEFHRLLARTTKNSVLVHLHDVLQGILLTYHRDFYRQVSTPAAELASHRALLAAVRAGDPERARQAMAAHLQGVSRLHHEYQRRQRRGDSKARGR